MKNCLHKLKIFKNGFTLAEVLITLVIVGVVAAFTIPTVINTYVESSTVAKVKKGLSILGQAKKLAEAQNGSIMGWDFSDGFTAEAAEQFWNYLKPHLSVAKDCGSNTDCYKPNGLYYMYGGSADHASNSKYYKFVLADGSVMWFKMLEGERCSSSFANLQNVCATFFHDVNGDKKPNTFGKDIFNYKMTIDNIYPDSRADCKDDSSSYGFGCSGYIIKNNNMNYLH